MRSRSLLTAVGSLMLAASVVAQPTPSAEPISGSAPAALAPQGAAKQAGNETAAALSHGFNEVSGWVTKAAALVPADKYNYRPSPTVRTFGQLVAHIADGSVYYCTTATGKKTNWSDAIEKGATDKAAIAAKLGQSFGACKTAYDNAGAAQFAPLIANIAHTNLHYGNIVTYMRMMGLTPPSSN